MSSEKMLWVLRFLFFAVVIGTPLFYDKWSVFPYTIPKAVFFEIAVKILFFLWLALAISDRRYRPKMTPLLWAIAACLGLLTLTAIFGVDPFRSFFSTEQRAFGIIMYYHLAALALVASALARELPWKKIFYASFGTSIVVVTLAALQLKILNLLIDERIDRPGATFGNPSFLAGYLIFNIFLAAYYLFELLKADKKKSSLVQLVFLFITVVVDTAGIFLTQTRGDLLGAFAGAFVWVALFALHPPKMKIAFLSRRSVYVGLLALLIIAAGTVWFTRTNSFWNRVPGLDRIKNISFSSQSSDIFPRIAAARAAWNGFLEKPLAGWGFENFNAVFSKYYDPRVLEVGYSETKFDKPHNILLEEVVSGGVLLLAAYLATLWFFAYEAKKTNDVLLSQFVFAVIVAYVVRSIFIFDTLGPAMMLYLLFGFVDGSNRRSVGSQNTGGRHAVHPGIVIAALVPAALLIWGINLTTFTASRHQFFGYKRIGDNLQKGIADFHRATEQWSPYQWQFTRDYANIMAQAYFYNRAMIPEGEIVSLVAKMEQVAAAHPNDAANHYLLTNIYNSVYDINPQDYLAKAEGHARRALQLSPNRQEVYYHLAKTKSLQGKNDEALALAKTALDLNPKVPDSHFYYGMLSFAVGRSGVGYEEVKTAIAMGRRWRDFYEPRVAADYFADAGHLAEAIEFYKTALVLQPGDLESEIKLGAAYFINGAPDLARPYLAGAAARFDFTKSPQYGQYKPILDALGIAARPTPPSPPVPPPASPPVSPVSPILPRP